METSKQAYTWELESWRTTRFSSQQAVIPSFHQLLFVFFVLFLPQWLSDVPPEQTVTHIRPLESLVLHADEGEYVAQITA